MPHVKMSSTTQPPVVFKKVRRRSSLFYSQSANDINSPPDENQIPINSLKDSSTSSSLLSSPDIISKRQSILPLCSKCRTTALSSDSSSAIFASTPNSPDPLFKTGFDPLIESPSPDNSPFFRPRRKSSHREPFVGSYEESLLSRRVAAVSCSNPVKFHVRIGVLGKGKYTGQCPPHLSTAVDAVFYDWKNSKLDTPTPNVSPSINSVSSSPSSSSLSEDAERGSPYVGTIDLNEVYVSRNNPNSKRFPGYHIPRQGQIQIVLSNLQKTAVDFFLIPYDLKKMPPGTKTFIRQKIYQSQPKKLIHAIHLQIACPKKNRLYLYGDVRLVFQNREISTVGSVHVKPKIETFNGDFAKLILPVDPVVDYPTETTKVCSECSTILEHSEDKPESIVEEESKVSSPISPATPTPIIPIRPSVTRLSSREELDNQMMEDINASFKLL